MGVCQQPDPNNTKVQISVVKKKTAKQVANEAREAMHNAHMEAAALAQPLARRTMAPLVHIPLVPDQQ